MYRRVSHAREADEVRRDVEVHPGGKVRLRPFQKSPRGHFKFVYICREAHIYIYISIYLYIYISILMYIYVCMYVYIHIHVHTYICIYIYIYMYMYIYIYIYMYMYKIVKVPDDNEVKSQPFHPVSSCFSISGRSVVQMID